MKILVVNAGSSSLKYQLIEMDNESVLAKGVCERIGQENAVLVHKGSKEVRIEKPMPTHKEAMQLVLAALVDKEYGVIGSMEEIAAVGHRVLHSGEDFKESVLIKDDEVLKRIEGNIELGPLHMPANVMGIKACKEVMPWAPQVAVFDTTFHSTMPDYAYMYAIRYEDYKKYKIRKYGFHGTSHLYITGEARKIMGADKCRRLVVCHLGNGASVSAVKDGKCIDTSMGLTPLEGLVMGTRSGDLDPAVLEFMMDKTGMNIHEMLNYLNKKSGVDGISGVGSDFRDLVKAYDEGNDRARLAIDMFSYRVKKYIGAYAAALNGLDCIVFTGGIGEHTEIVREKVMKDMEYLGVDFDFEKNNHVGRGNVTELSKPDSKVKVYIIPTNEELVIARETLRLK
ncbi:MAG: acetate kinase [Firmicutes bacterium]|jgi:acetate kinase|nr:acetate kinase [Bacillota bacterium]